MIVLLGDYYRTDLVLLQAFLLSPYCLGLDCIESL